MSGPITTGVTPSDTGAEQAYDAGKSDANAQLATMRGLASGAPASSPDLQKMESLAGSPRSAGSRDSGIPAGMGRGPGSKPFEGAPPPSDDAISAAQDQLAANPYPAPQSTDQPAAAPAPPAKPGLGFKGTGDQIVSHLQQGFVSLGRMLSDGTNSPLMRASFPGLNDVDPHGDAHAFVNKLFDEAANYWKTDDSKAGFGARLVGDAAGMVPSLLIAPVAAGAMAATAGNDTLNDYQRAGTDARTSSILALVAALSTYAGAKIPLQGGILKRVATGIGGNLVLTPASEVLTKAILNNAGYQEAASKIDPLDPDSIARSGIMGAIFGAIGGHQEGKVKAPEPPKPAPPPSGGAPEPPEPAPPPSVVPPSPEQSPVAAAPEPAPPPTPAPPPKVPDVPTAEPVKDLRAQFNDMRDPKTPRGGVFLSTDNLAALKTASGSDGLAVKSQLNQATAQGRVLELPNGQLILKTKALAITAGKNLAAGDDPQAVIGSITGAGSGKTPEQTVVVQGHDETGAVAVEKGVTPEEVPAAVKAVVEQGKNPIITTPQEALQRRQVELAKESSDTAPSTPPVAEPAANVPSKEDTDSAAAVPTSEPKMGIFKTDNGKERAVHIEDGAPAGKMRVRPIDDDGTPMEHTMDVPAERVSTGTKVTPPAEAQPVTSEAIPDKQAATESPPEQAPATDSKPPEQTTVEETPKGGSAMAALPDALRAHEKQEYVPSGRKFATSLTERQDNASAFANVLKAAAKETKGDIPEDLYARAIKSASDAIGLTSKSAEATAKGQGTGHSKITALVAEMHKVSRQLLGTSKAGDEVSIPVKAAVLKAKVAKKKGEPEAVAKPVEPELSPQEKIMARARAKQAPVEKPAEKVEVPVNEKYVADLKPKALGEKENTRVLALRSRYVGAETDAEAAKHRATIEEILKQFNRPPKEIEQVLNFIDTERQEAVRERSVPKPMSETMEEEDNEYGEDLLKGEGMSKTWRPDFSGTKTDQLKQQSFDINMTRQWKKLGDWMDDSFVKELRERPVTQPIGAHEFLNRIMQLTGVDKDMAALHGIVTNVRAHAPDVPIFNTSNIISTEGQVFPSGIRGLFQSHDRSIQIDFDRIASGDSAHQALMTGLHEIMHSATSYELLHNPDGPLAKAMDNARDILEARFRKRYGDAFVQQHLDYFNGEGAVARPAGFKRSVYGMTNTHEMAAEIQTNPAFMREVAESEKYAGADESMPLARSTLLTRIFRAIGKYFGFDDARLLQHISDLTSQVMERQYNRSAMLREGKMADFLSQSKTGALLTTAMERAKAARGLRAIAETPPPLPEARRRSFADIMGEDESEEPSKIAASFNHVTKGRAIDALRHTIMALKTQGQIFRDHMVDFGGDSNSNPLRELQEADINKNILIHKMATLSKPVAKAWGFLKKEDERAMSQLMIDTTMYRIDPRLISTAQPKIAQDRPGFDARYAEYKARYDKLSDDAQQVYSGAADANKAQIKELRKAGIDTALRALDVQLTPAQKALLYGVKTPQAHDSIVGEGKLIDVGDQNDKLKAALKDFAGMTEIEGPYFHLGRQGEYVVAARPEGTRTFNEKAKAEEWATRARELSPDSTAVVGERGGKHVVDYNIKYVSIHETRRDAEAEQRRIVGAGFDPGLVTRKTMGSDSAPLSYGFKELVSEAERRITRDGADEGTQAMVSSLRSAFLQMTAARSAYSGSRLARKSVGGVKAEDMLRNFSQHSTSTMWHAAQMRTVFDQASALAKVRGMARENHEDGVSQGTIYRRGEVVRMLNLHANDEVQNYGHKAPLNSVMAKLGFASFLASPSHALIWMTQNFTTGIPWAGARYGYGRSTNAFMHAMTAVTSPAMRATMAEKFAGLHADPSSINEAVLKYISTHPRFGKWAQGPNSALQQLVDRGVLDHGYANELGEVGRGTNQTVSHVFAWARLLPAMADSFNRVSTALAGLELTGGDVRKTSDMVQIVHADYSAQNKPLAFKKINRVPGMTSLTMFKTYAQEMTHLLYSNLANTVRGGDKFTAAKTVAGLVMGNALFAGVYGGAALAPLQLAMYAYHKIADQEGETWDFKNAVHMFLVDHFGKSAGNTMAYGLPHAIGVDVSSRMGLADLLFHNPPDLLTTDIEMWKDFVYQEAGTMPQLLAQSVTGFMKHMQKGEPVQAISSLIPVKQFQDATKAWQLFNGGKQDSLGARMTEPSTGDAVAQLIGFKPASVAEAQEKQSARVEVGKGIKAAKSSIIKAYVTAQDQGALSRAEGRMQDYNARFPESAIKASDLMGMERLQQEDEQGITRHPDVTDRTRF